MALLSDKKLAGPGFIILNVMRAMNIIALASVVASSVVMLVKTFIVSKFFFFDATSHVITAIVGLFLIVSECSLFRTYFARNWPLLSPSHGFVSLGCAMMVLGLNMLGNMNKEATSQKSLGLPFWRLLVASGILCFVIGIFNIVASYIFRDSSRNITARRVRSRGAMSLQDTNEDLEAEVSSKLAFTITTHHTGSSTSRTGSPHRVGTPPVDCGSPQPAAASPQKEDESFNPLRALRNVRQSILPSYHSTSPTKNTLFPFHHRRSSSVYSRSTSGGEPLKKKFWQRQQRDSDVPRMPEISAPMNNNPQFAYLAKPNLAHHPSQRRPDADFEKF